MHEVAQKALRLFEGSPHQLKWTVLQLLQWAGVKSDAPNTIDFFKRYLGGTGERYTLDPVPLAWQEEIEKRYRDKAPGRYLVNPYKWGVYDLQNSLGHFELTIVRNADGSRTYTLDDVYEFPYFDDDGKLISHGFGADPKLEGLASGLLPATTYKYGQRFEFKTLGKTRYLLLPTEWLQTNGTRFAVHGQFDDISLLIEKHLRKRVGVTWYFNEQGLADQLAGMGQQEQRIAAVFARLSKEHGSDADEVAEDYVRALQKQKQLSRLKTMPKVVKALREALNSGLIVTDGEKECIKTLGSF
jgi:hypothetical protein